MNYKLYIIDIFKIISIFFLIDKFLIGLFTLFPFSFNFLYKTHINNKKEIYIIIITFINIITNFSFSFISIHIFKNNISKKVNIYKF